MKTISPNPFQFITLFGLMLSLLIPISSKAQYISFSSFKKLQQADYSDISNYLISNNWALKDAKESKDKSAKYIIFEKGISKNGATVKISFDKYKDSFRGNVIQYGTFNKALFDKTANEAKMSGWKSDEPVIKDGKFLLCYTDGNNAILLGPVTRDGFTFQAR